VREERGAGRRSEEGLQKISGHVAGGGDSRRRGCVGLLLRKNKRQSGGGFATKGTRLGNGRNKGKLVDFSEGGSRRRKKEEKTRDTESGELVRGSHIICLEQEKVSYQEAASRVQGLRKKRT